MLSTQREKTNYPAHIFDSIRIEIASSYIKHEFRKLLRRVSGKYWTTIDEDVSDWINSPELANPRDFWNGFHGISMGFKLKIGLIYLVTAENIVWKKTEFPVDKLWFGVELQQTKIVGEGKISAASMSQYFLRAENRKERQKQLDFTLKLSGGTSPRDMHPIIAVQKEEEEKIIYSVFDGNRRLAKAVLQGQANILTYLGTYKRKDKSPKNYWIPTSILMDTLFFAKIAYDNKNNRLFYSYMDIFKDMLSRSESAVFEMKERALTSKQPFRDDVLKALNLLD